MKNLTKSKVLENENNRIVFTLTLARALQQFGIPSHRLEEALRILNQRLEMNGQFFSSPSVIMAAFGNDDHQKTFFLRASSGDLNLAKLDQLDSLVNKVADGRLSPKQGIAEIKRIVSAPNRYGFLLTCFCFLLASAGSARLFGGGWREMAVSSVIGFGLSLLLRWTAEHETLSKAVPALAGFGAVLLANSATLLVGPYSVYTATVTGLIVLLPGLSLTVSITELATGHPIAGTARLANASVTFLMLGFGVAMGSQIDQFLPALTHAGPIPLPFWTELIALAIAPLAFVVLFSAKPNATLWILFGSWAAYGVARYGGAVFGPEVGAFAAAMSLTLGSNLFARIANRPAAIVQVPGIMFLVPGSLGFKSMSWLLKENTVAGLETAFEMTLTAVALAAGLIFGNLLYRSKRAI